MMFETTGLKLQVEVDVLETKFGVKVMVMLSPARWLLVVVKPPVNETFVPSAADLGVIEAKITS